MTAPFSYGGVDYPLRPQPAGTSLLALCDPAIDTFLEFFASVIGSGLSTALTDVALTVGAPITTNVAYKLPIDPADVLTESSVKFPLLSLVRVSSLYEERTVNWEHDVGHWKLSYVLPTLTAAQAETIVPVLKAVSHIVHHAIRAKADSGYAGGANVYATAGIESMWLRSGAFGRYELGDGLYFPCWSADLDVAEIVTASTRGLPAFTGANLTVTDGLVQSNNPVPATESRIDVT